MGSKGRKKRQPRKLHRILILCEDEKSSRYYFESFPFDRDKVLVECIGTGMNTDSLVEEAISRKESAKRTGAPFAAIWVVFDRDEFPEKNWNRAFDLARDNNINACWSNPCFELWYLLHFEFRNTGVHRHDLPTKLNEKLSGGYSKSDSDIFMKIREFTSIALENGIKLENLNGPVNRARNENPSTYVHKLVQKLQSLSGAT